MARGRFVGTRGTAYPGDRPSLGDQIPGFSEPKCGSPEPKQRCPEASAPLRVSLERSSMGRVPQVAQHPRTGRPQLPPRRASVHRQPTRTKHRRSGKQRGGLTRSPRDTATTTIARAIAGSIAFPPGTATTAPLGPRCPAGPRDADRPQALPNAADDRSRWRAVLRQERRADPSRLRCFSCSARAWGRAGFAEGGAKVSPLVLYREPSRTHLACPTTGTHRACALPKWQLPADPSNRACARPTRQFPTRQLPATQVVEQVDEPDHR